MAHYIAELIQETEKASDKDRPAKMQLCFDTILMLWERRYSLPNGSRPFENIEPLMRALESLDPENVTPRYFREVRSAAKGVNESDEAAKWLKYIDSIDYSARILIRQCLDRAAQTAKNNTEDWVSLAEAAGAVNHAESSLVRMIADEKSILIKTDLQKVTKEIIEDRLNHFVRLIEVATLIVIELQEKIQESQPTNDEA